MTSLFDDYRTRLAGMPEDKFIGSLLWFTITGKDEFTGKYTPVRITRDQLAEWFEELDLDPKYLPARIWKVNAFRKASSAVRQEYDGPEPGQTTVLRVVEIDHNDEWVLRHVLRDVHDKRTQTTTTSHVATLKFFKAVSAGKAKTGEHYKTSINHNLIELGLDQQPTNRKYPLGLVDQQHVEQLLADFEDRYAEMAINLDANAVRAVVRNYVLGINSIMVKPSGGIYFAHTSRWPTIDKLQQLVKKVGQGCSFSQTPLIDTPNERELLTEAFQSQVTTHVDRLLKDIAEANETAKGKPGGRIPVAEYTGFSSRFADLMSKADEYTRVLGLSQGRAASSLELVMDAIGDMAGRLDAGTKTTARKKAA